MNLSNKNIKKIDSIIFNLLILKNKRPVDKLKESDIKYLCDESIKLLNKESTLLKLNGDPVTRLEIVKSVLRPFIERRKGDRLGLILGPFGGRFWASGRVAQY